MQRPSPAPCRPDRSDVRRILVAGALVGIIDALFAILAYVVVLEVCTTVQLFQGIARGLLGRSAFRGGLATAALGVVCHFVVAYGWTLVFWLALRRWRALQSWVRTPSGLAAVGAAVGVVIWLLMDLVVIPLSRAVPTPVASRMFAILLVEHALLVGPPMVWILARKGSR